MLLIKIVLLIVLLIKNYNVKCKKLFIFKYGIEIIIKFNTIENKNNRRKSHLDHKFEMKAKLLQITSVNLNR